MMTGYNIMLEYMSIFKINMNEMLKIFINSIDKREDNLEQLGLGNIHPSPPLVIYKFFEKSTRFFFSHKVRRRPDQTDLQRPIYEDYVDDTPGSCQEQEQQRWYDEAIEQWKSDVSFKENLDIYPNKYKICSNDAEFYERFEIWRVSYIYDICFLEDVDENNDYLPFRFEAEINNETKEILEQFLERYQDIDYMSVDDSELYKLDRRYREIVEEGIFLKALYKFKESIGTKENTLNLLRSQFNLNRDVIQHLQLFIRGPPAIPEPDN